MTYCVAMCLADGVVFASDSRTNAGVDHIATFKKLHVFAHEDRVLVLQSAGNLATTQSVISLLGEQQHQDGPSLRTVNTLYEAATLVGQTIRSVMARDGGQQQSNVNFGCNILLGGQIQGEGHRLFHIYPEGNFIESSVDTPYFQIGESKYGKPIIDRIIDHNTALETAMQCALISIDSTLRSNLSVGLPLDILIYEGDSLSAERQYRIGEHHPHFLALRKAWGEGLQQLFRELPPFNP
ncbi:putative proteasome-type protease [Aeromonas sp. RU39B]|uniref:proteasome-type protease n=1 Tax=Aeromonas sp. RU39B TaxID=1907416 RepID=UPI0009566688|nr:proteasome-type protease [Aeromonas sp. RU39B]SIQ02610.1 putative proteasome-type protease [Aeromonas sp. RU39B]